VTKSENGAKMQQESLNLAKNSRKSGMTTIPRL
jgi:hypothetical protein